MKKESRLPDCCGLSSNYTLSLKSCIVRILTFLHIFILSGLLVFLYPNPAGYVANTDDRLISVFKRVSPPLSPVQ